MSSNAKIPNSLNRIKIFSRDYPVLKKLLIAVILLQGISLWTEYIGFNNYLKDLLITNGFGIESAAFWAAAGSLFLACIIELLFAVLIIFVVNCIIDPSYVTKSVILTDLTAELKEKGVISDEEQNKAVDVGKIATAIHIGNWIKLGSAFLVLIAITIISITVSKKNVDHAIATNPTPATLIDTAPLYAQKTSTLSSIEDRYEKQEAKLRNQYQLDTLAIYAKYKGDIDNQKAQIQKYEARQSRDGRNYGTSIARRNADIANVYKKIGPELQKRTAELNKSLEDLYQKREKNYKASEQRMDVKIAESERENKRRELLKTEQNQWMASVLKRYAQWATIFAGICWIWITISRWTSGIEKEPRVKPEEFSTSIWEDTWTLITVAPTRLLQNLVRLGLSRVKMLRPLPYQGANYDLETLHGIQEALKKIEKTNSLELLNLEIKSIKNRREKSVDRRRNRGGNKRRWTWFSTRSSTRNQDVDSTPNKSVDDDESTLSLEDRKSVDKEGVDGADSSVATRSTADSVGVDGLDVEDVESTPKGSVDGTDVDGKTKRRLTAKSTPTKTKKRPNVDRRRKKAETKGVDVDFKLDFGDASDFQSFHGEVNVNGERIKIRTTLVDNQPRGVWYGDIRDEKFIANQKSNYTSFLNKNQRNPSTNKEKIAVATGLLNLIAKHREALSESQKVVYTKK